MIPWVYCLPARIVIANLRVKVILPLKPGKVSRKLFFSIVSGYNDLYQCFLFCIFFTVISNRNYRDKF